MSRLWIVNASPLITLARISRINLLTQLCPDPIIPHAVAAEIQAGDESDAARQWLLNEGRRFVGEATKPDSRVVPWDLGQGETEVLSLGLLRQGSEVIIDDLAARNCALSLKVPVRGTLGIIILAKRQSLISLAAPVFNDLIRAGLHVNVATLNQALKLVEES